VIFLTVGEQLPFDRLVQTVDEWSGASKKEVFAQIGRTNYTPSHIVYKAFLTPEEFKSKFMAAEVIVAHSGMGTIISALEFNKPILVMPRQAELGEHRNNHQFATAKRFLELDYIAVAFNEVELKAKLDNIGELLCGVKRKQAIGPSPLLIKTIRDFMEVR
jgi:UDP-N-acetylglucosamine transferase subunit ALG13